MVDIHQTHRRSNVWQGTLSRINYLKCHFWEMAVKYFLNFGWLVEKKDSLSINKPFALFRSLSFVKNRQNLSRLLLRPFTKFGVKVWKIFWTRSFYIRHILYHFVSFMNKKFCSAWISQLPIWPPNSKKDCKTLMRLCHPPDGSTSHKYKLLCFITTKKICKEQNTLAFNRDRCCHLVLCLRLIPFH